MRFAGCLCKKATDQTTANYTTETAVVWDTDVYDTHNFHSTSSNTDTITVPAVADGLKIRLRVSLALSSIGNKVLALVYKNGTVICGQNADFGSGADGASKIWINIVTPIQVAATNDAYVVKLTVVTDTSVTVDAGSSYFSLQVLGNQIAQGCIATLNADKLAQNYSTPSVLAWDGTDVFDPDACHDPASSNTKIIVPSAYNGYYGIVRANLAFSAVAVGSSISACIQKGGVDTHTGFAGYGSYQELRTTPDICLSSAAHVLTAADEYEVRVFCSDASINLEAPHSQFSLWIVGTG